MELNELDKITSNFINRSSSSEANKTTLNSNHFDSLPLSLPSPSSSSPSSPSIALAWRNLHYFACHKRFNVIPTHLVPILRQINGTIYSGTLTAVMGPSGSGKTTLLHCLSVVISPSTGTKLAVNQSNKKMIATSVLVEQQVQKSILDRLTVRQLLRYAYQFKNDVNGFCKHQMDYHIQTVMDQMLLNTDVLDREFRQCSDGEQKRIAIAQELMTDWKRKRIKKLQSKSETETQSRLLLIDEPVTGLDSTSALVVLQALRRLTTTSMVTDKNNNNHNVPPPPLTIVISIHLPSQEMLQLFDQLYVLAKGGVCIYAGTPLCITSSLEQILGTSKMSYHASPTMKQQQQPPIEQLIKIACNGHNDLTVQKLANELKATERTTSIDHLQTLTNSNEYRDVKHFTIVNLITAIKRQTYSTLYANRHIMFGIIALYVSYFFLLSTMFSTNMATISGCISLNFFSITMVNSNSDNNNHSSTIVTNTCVGDQLKQESLLKENVNFLVYTFMCVGVVTICLSSLLYVNTLNVFCSEYRNHWYSLGVFYCSTTLITILEVTIYSVLVATLAYCLTSQHAADNYHINWYRLGHFIFFIWLLAIYWQGYGQLFSLLCNGNIDVALILCAVYHSFATILNGFFVDTDDGGGSGDVDMFDDDDNSKNVTFNTQNWNQELIAFESHLVGLKYVSRAIIYTLYDLDTRCGDANNVSLLLLYLRVDRSAIHTYIWYIVANIITIRMITIVCLVAKFNPFSLILYRWIQRHWLVLLCVPETTNSTIGGDDANNNNIFYTNSIQLQINPGNNEDEMKNNYHQNINDDNYVKIRGKIAIAWRNLTLYGHGSWFDHHYHHQQQQSPKTLPSSTSTSLLILRNLSGHLRFGTLTGLMGSSGSGKTSLLTVLNGRAKPRLCCNSRFYLSKYVKLETCFIAQHVDGHLLPGLNAHQQLVYASRLKNRTITNAVDHNQVAQRILTELDLQSAAHTRAEQCSGGEKKRLALALELTSLERMPNLICIDEPTSGLDSNSADLVISCLRKLTQHYSLCIIASLHQPNSRVLSTFDQLYVLARGGTCIYSGPSDGIATHLTTTATTNTQPSSTTQLLALEQLIKYSATTTSSLVIEKLSAKMQKQELESNKLEMKIVNDAEEIPGGIVRQRVRFSFRATYLLFIRCVHHETVQYWWEWLLCISMYFLYGYTLTLFFNANIAKVDGCLEVLTNDTMIGSYEQCTSDTVEDSDYDDSSTLQYGTLTASSSIGLLTGDAQSMARSFALIDNAKYNFFFASFYLLCLMLQSSIQFRRELLTWLRAEHRNRWYSVGVYYLCRSTLEFAPVIPLNAIYISITGLLYERVRPGIYWHFLLLFTLGAIAYQGLAHVLTLCTRRNVSLHVMATCVTFWLFTLLSNFLLPLSSLHYLYRALSNVSISRFVFEASMILEYGFGRCSSESTSGKTIIQSVLYTMQLRDENYLHCLQMLTLLIIFYHSIALYLLYTQFNSTSTLINTNKGDYSGGFGGQQLEQRIPNGAIITGMDPTATLPYSGLNIKSIKV